MQKVQEWLQDNLGIILGVCVGIAVIEVWVPSPRPSRCSVLPDCPCSVGVLVEAEAHQLIEALLLPNGTHGGVPRYCHRN